MRSIPGCWSPGVEQAGLQLAELLRHLAGHFQNRHVMEQVLQTL